MEVSNRISEISKESDVCEVVCFNIELVAELRNKVQAVDRLSDLFKVLSDKTRLKILYALSGEELCVCDIANIVDLSLPAVSHHLRILRNLKLVKHYKTRRMVYYTLADARMTDLINEGIKHLDGTELSMR